MLVANSIDVFFIPELFILSRIGFIIPMIQSSAPSISKAIEVVSALTELESKWGMPLFVFTSDNVIVFFVVLFL